MLAPATGLNTSAPRQLGMTSTRLNGDIGGYRQRLLDRRVEPVHTNSGGEVELGQQVDGIDGVRTRADGGHVSVGDAGARHYAGKGLAGVRMQQVGLSERS